MEFIHRTKPHVGILFGGKSAEHQISLRSARNVIAALDATKFTPILIGIDTQGGWHSVEPAELAMITTIHPSAQSKPAAHLLAPIEDTLGGLDIIFPVLHGPFGEDGTIQGFLEYMNIPYVGCGVMSSAICMDKDVMKRLLRAATIAVTDWMSLTIAERQTFNPKTAIDKFGLPLFVKPANMGSSIGVSKVTRESELAKALDEAFRYDHLVLIEKAVIGTEVECAVLGNDMPTVSVPGRISAKTDHYTYSAKYDDKNNTILEIPANVPASVKKHAQATALKAYTTLRCEGLARVDMFVTPDGRVLVNELNTMPGFTAASMYPQLWEATDLSYTQLITQLLTLAVDRFRQRQQLATSYHPA